MTTNHPNNRRGATIALLPTRRNRTKATEPVLITEQEVVFGTAAAMPLPHRTTIRRWTTALHHVFTFSAADHHNDKPRHYPRPRSAVLEQGLMGREMYRL